MAIRHDPPVVNQFLQDGNRGITACIPICILAIYHMAEEFKEKYNDNCASILNEEQWSIVMKRGIRTWEIWYEKQSKIDPGIVFPKIEEILKLPQCDNFYNIFKKEDDIDERERSGLAIQSKRYDNPLGTLYGLCRAMTEFHKDVYTIAIMPIVAAAVVLVSRPRPDNNGYRFWLFDSHGAKGSDYITLLEFSDFRDAVRYLRQRYQLESIDDYKPIKGVKHDETDLMEMYSYSASLFTTK